MPDFADTWIYHITGISNLRAIMASGAILSDMALCSVPHQVIGYGHIKQRRMTEYRVPCCPGAPFVGEFVPFYYSPRSVMLYTVNIGSTGLPPGCQRDIVHLVSTINSATAHGTDWAISDGNAGAAHTSFYGTLDSLASLDWNAINERNWSGRQHQKSAEFLVRDQVPWSAIRGIGCFDERAAAAVAAVLSGATHAPQVKVLPEWYY